MIHFVLLQWITPHIVCPETGQPLTWCNAIQYDQKSRYAHHITWHYVSCVTDLPSTGGALNMPSIPELVLEMTVSLKERALFLGNKLYSGIIKQAGCLFGRPVTYIYPPLKVGSIFISWHCNTGVCEQQIPAEKKTHRRIGSQNIAAGAGEQLLLLGCRAKAGVKRDVLFTDTGMNNKRACEDIADLHFNVETEIRNIFASSLVFQRWITNPHYLHRCRHDT